MAEHFSFFDAVLQEDGVTYDREYDAEEFTDYFKTLVTTGVMKGAGNMLAVSANGSNMVTKIDTGIAFIEGKYYKNDSFKELTHDTETLGNSRIDRIVIRMDSSTEARYVKAFIKKGVPSTNPVAPALTQTANLYEISLAQVKIVGGQTFISTNAVTDERGTKVICPWAGSNILPNFNDEELEQLINTINNTYQLTNRKSLKEYSGHPNNLSDTGFYRVIGATTAGGYPLNTGAGSSLLEVFAIEGEDTIMQRFTFSSSARTYSYVRSKRNSTTWNDWFIGVDMSSKADAALSSAIKVTPQSNWKGAINVTRDNFGIVFVDFTLSGGSKTANIPLGSLPYAPREITYFNIVEYNINGLAVQTNQGFILNNNTIMYTSVAIHSNAYSISTSFSFRTT